MTADSPAALRRDLEEVAHDLAFSWTPGARSLFADLDPDRFEALDHNPTAFLAELPEEAFAAALERGLGERTAEVRASLERQRTRRTWWDRRNEDERFCVAYFSCEFGLDESLPIYSGGLGVLAGDHLKSASGLGVPLVAVGLMYRRGYFRQSLDENDRQTERYPDNDPARLPLTPEDVTVEVELADASGALVPVQARVWRVQVGRVSLHLLDTDLEGNPAWARTITDALYGGDREHRIRQELVLGLGGVRALRALGVEPTVFHLNEGHSAFLQLERLRRLVEEDGVALESALQRLRASTVFTTHTPVPAGNEAFDMGLVRRNLESLVARCGFGSWEEFAELGRLGDDARFGMTPFALRTSAYANAVSALHGEVSREMWHGLWPGRSADEAPIGSVTNGVHARTWVGEELVARLGSEEDTDAPDFARAYDLDDETLWEIHRAAKTRLLDAARRRYERQGGGELRFDPDALTIGFARRFATYKRAGLLFRDEERLARLLADSERPLQIVFTGKAHPADEGGKDLIARVVRFTRDARANGRIVFLEDYEMTLARRLVQGVDVWLNNPRRPHEASGTSGMKAAMNGGVNCSILDGWWAEAYSSEVGFAIGGNTVAPSDEEQDAVDAAALLDVLEQQVLPAFYERDERGLPPRWLPLMRNSIAQLGARFSSDRMLIEYVEELYLPAHRDLLAALSAA
ncbi:MAG TPA: alpha-glucan family phosphorylase [Gaiellaceae bacterium]|nr:alpha-glucan family phosphorylase [Gaiellaceae bacterium]